MATIQWEELKDTTPAAGMGWFDTSLRLQRTKVPDGWIVREEGKAGNGLTFVPDPNHTWK